jgi:hypothetical protein
VTRNISWSDGLRRDCYWFRFRRTCTRERRGEYSYSSATSKSSTASKSGAADLHHQVLVTLVPQLVAVSQRTWHTIARTTSTWDRMPVRYAARCQETSALSRFHTMRTVVYSSRFRRARQRQEYAPASRPFSWCLLRPGPYSLRWPTKNQTRIQAA